MRLLLPPSESKRDGTLASPLHLHSLVAPELHDARSKVLTSIGRYCAKPTPAVRRAIGTTANQDAELARNASLLTAPTAPAHAIYDGVLFDAIALDTCTPAMLMRLCDRVLVQSALFGVVSYGDAIPAYRCSADSTLPRLGRLSAYWRAHLDRAMPALVAGHVVVDLRSSSYAPMWNPGPALREQVVTVKVMQLRNGRRTAVSHMNKATKGRIVRALGTARATPQSIDAVARALEASGFDITLAASRTGATLEVLAPDL